MLMLREADPCAGRVLVTWWPDGAAARRLGVAVN